NELGDLALDATRPRHLGLPRLVRPIQLEPRVPGAAQVRRCIGHAPAATARAPGEPSGSYRQLGDQVAFVRAKLSSAGVTTGDVVAVSGDRSPGLIATMLAVFEHGAVLLTLDSALPVERRRLMVERAKARLIVAVGGESAVDPPSHEQSTFDKPTVHVAARRVEATAADPAPVAPVDGHSPAYVFFTSGTTGTPKAVLGRHAGLGHFLAWQRDTFGIGPGDRAAQLTGLSFDVVLRDVFLPLVSGATLDIPEPDDTTDLLAWLARRHMTVFHTVPSLMQSWLGEAADDARLPAVERLFSAGEPLVDSLVMSLRRLFPNAEIVNLYGPTETTLAKCYLRVPDPPFPGVQPVGEAIPGAQAIVLRDDGRPCGIGEVGEIAIRTPYRSAGYLDDPDETARRFLANPTRHDADDVLYRTGDRGRHRADGLLGIHGRLDHQLKVRGVRVEPAEVTAVLLSLPEVRAGVVVGDRDERGENRLVAYAVADQDVAASSDTYRADLRAALAERLPAALVPSVIVRLDRLPLTANGKVDRRALPAVEAVVEEAGTRTPPRTDTEKTVAAVWSRVLGIDVVMVEDDFFQLGGHSILATRVIARLRHELGIELGLRDLFATPTVAGLAARIDGDDHGEDESPLVVVPRLDEGMPLSFAQQRLWFLDRLEPGQTSYNVPVAIRLDGPLDIERLHTAFDRVVERHESLRTTFSSRDGVPVQHIHPPGAWSTEAERIDIGELDAADSTRMIADVVDRPFDLETGPLIRWTLLRARATSHVLVVVVHHIVNDALSQQVLVRDLVTVYQTGAELPALDLQYVDYAAWQRHRLDDRLADQLTFWHRALAGVEPLALPTKTVPGAAADRRAAAVDVHIPATFGGRLAALAKTEQATVFMTLLAALSVVLGRLARQDDVTIGTPIANRDRLELEPLIGFFVNSLVLRTDLSGEPTFRELLGRVRRMATEAYDHRDLPFEKLVEALDVPRDTDMPPLFRVMLVFHTAREDAAPRAAESSGDLTGDNITVTPVAIPATHAKLDLSLVLHREGDAFVGRFEYRTALFDRPMIERLAGQLETLLAGVVADPDRPVSDVPMLDATERRRLLACSKGDRVAVAPKPVHRQVIERARTGPDRLAFVTESGATLTYGELVEQGSRWARVLRGLGVGPERVVVVLAPRSPALAIGAFAALEAGGAYVALDPIQPVERANLVLDDVRPVAVLTVGTVPEGLVFDGPIFDLDREPSEVDEDPSSTEPLLDQLAYVVYTSGSTGRPKGVALAHRGLINLVAWGHRTFALGPDDHATMVISPGFDAAIWELWSGLAAGLTLHVPDATTLADPPRLAAFVADRGITFGTFPTPLGEALLQAGVPEHARIRQVVVGGDRLTMRPPADAGFQLVNGYGPAEATVSVTMAWIEAEGDGDLGPPALGMPSDNVQVHVLDPRLEPVASGVPGEIVIGGIQLARGYVGRPATTAERFVPDPFATEPGSRLYRTGDLATRDEDGRLHFVGRADFQVKIRGVRIEPGEVETVLRDQPGVAEAVVDARTLGADRRLVAWVAPDTGRELDPTALREALAEALPAAMVPAHIVVLERLPRRATSLKVDRSRLPDPEVDNVSARGAAPSSATEIALAALWRELLGVETIGVDDDFFALGGHSLLAMRVVTRVRDRLGVALPVKTLFEHARLGELAAEIDLLERSAAGPLEPVPRDRPLPLSFAQRRMWFLDQLEPGSTTYHMIAGVRLHGELDPAELIAAFTVLAHRHESLRTTFERGDEGPVQVIHDQPSVDLRQYDLSHEPDEDALDRLVGELANQPFDLARGPLVRFHVVRLATDEHVALLIQHHIVSDGVSQSVLIHELGEAYRARRDARTPELPPLAVQYADWAVYQQAHLDDARLGEQIDYWRDTLADAPTLIHLPLDHPRPPVRDPHGARVDLTLDAAVVGALDRLARATDATPFMILMAALGATLHRHGAGDDVLIGTPVAGRERTELEGVIGFFVNTLVLRLRPRGDVSFRDLVRDARDRALDAYAHQDVPFERLVEALEPPRDLGHTPFFQVMLAFEDGASTTLDLGDIRLEPLTARTEIAKFDLVLFATRHPEGLAMSLQYATALFEADSARALLNRLGRLLTAAVATPDLPVRELA
ncbi:MAG: amino acid adenylation domain-containing protein, partial [Acidobacteriota bacterium]